MASRDRRSAHRRNRCDLAVGPHIPWLGKLPGDIAVEGKNFRFPDWAHGGFVSITRTRDDLTVVCRQDVVPHGVHCDSGWRCLQLVGQFTLTEVGVIASLTKPLAEAEISVFVIGTFETDYLLVKDSSLTKAVAVLEFSGHSVRSQ
ncbi:MAG: ACT domain-containing protein [Planctomycetes bacterium]|nr:ACT domain-containing protein [Planctomycetota bacterium]MBL7041497.1 ACT domain-containing protein [Pirellulaceae bacterium]